MQGVDDTDRRILRHLQADASRSTTDLAEYLGLAASALTRRLERLERIGVIEGYTAAIDWRVLGYEVEVSLRVTLDKTQANRLMRLSRRRATSPRWMKSRRFWAGLTFV